MNSLRHFPLGAPFPDSPHAVVSSLPTMADVCGYEEREARVLDAMRSGYPRFVVNAYVAELIEFYLERAGFAGRGAVLVLGAEAVRGLLEFAGEGAVAFEVDDGLQLVHFTLHGAEVGAQVRKYVQHVGCGVSSRQAEDLLLRHGRLRAVHEEAVFEGDASVEVQGLLAGLYACSKSELFLCPSGMSAFYMGFRAAQAVQAARGRTRWLQLGWLYLDSGCILKDFLADGEVVEYCYDVNDTAALLAKIAELGESLAAVVVECPTNPLVQVCDLGAVSGAVRASGGLLIVDPTVASLYNVDVLRYADLVVNSLTKYAANEGDVMLGSLAVGPDSVHAADLLNRVSALCAAPYGRDVQRLAYEMQGAPELVAKMGANAEQLVVFLEGHPAVRSVYYAGASSAFSGVARDGATGGGMISLELLGSMQAFYDTVSLMKGPSFGTCFTLLSPFMYLAHYDLVTSEEGRGFLRDVGIAPDLIRISVGVEPISELKAVFQAALDVSMAAG